eukprot:2545068-Rhodomonas_salina.2
MTGSRPGEYEEWIDPKVRATRQPKVSTARTRILLRLSQRECVLRVPSLELKRLADHPTSPQLSNSPRTMQVKRWLGALAVLTHPPDPSSEDPDTPSAEVLWSHTSHTLVPPPPDSRVLPDSIISSLFPS